MHIVIVIANSYSEFRDLVLKDALSIGPGAITFVRGEERTVRFRPLEDPEYTIRYMWVTNYQEIKDVLDQDHFRVISKTNVSHKKIEIPYAVVAGMLVAVMSIIIFFTLKR